MVSLSPTKSDRILINVSTVMCPNRKLQWFIDRNWSDEALEIIHTRARVAFQRFRMAPPPAHAHSGPASSTTSAQATISAASTASPFHPGPTTLASTYVTSDSIRFVSLDSHQFPIWLFASTSSPNQSFTSGCSSIPVRVPRPSRPTTRSTAASQS